MSLLQRLFSWETRKRKTMTCIICCNQTHKREEGFASETIASEVYSRSAESCHLCALICDIYDVASEVWRQSHGSEFFTQGWEEEKIYTLFYSSKHPPRVVFKDISLYVFLPKDPNNVEDEEELQDYQEHPTLPVWAPVLEHAGSRGSLMLARRWLRRCLKEHPGCADTRCVDLPDRLLYIRKRADKSKSFEVQLVETDGDKGSYVALSHCWGKEQPLKTRNKEDLIEWKKDIPWARLPRTFQDAIQVTAFLGYRFLWIDSICIIQEDQEDWERQSAKMGSIYQNSLLTIAAAAASGHEKGMLVRKDILAGTVMLGSDFPAPTPVRFQELLDHKFLLDPIDPIDMRAWTYQERLLPPRSLLYSTAEMKWECNAIHCCECGMNNTKFQDDRHDYNFRNVAQFTKAEALHFWYTRVVPVYSRRNLTKGTDKLPALSGVVARLSPRIEGRYLGGIWEQHVIFGLSWVASHTIPYPRPIELCPSYQAPTFSWASISGGVRYRAENIEANVEATKMLEATCTLAGANPFGHVKDASIIVEGPVAPSWIRIPETWDGGAWVDYSWDDEKPKPDYRMAGFGFKCDTQLAASPLPKHYPAEEWCTGSDIAPHRSSDVEIKHSGDWYRAYHLLLYTAFTKDDPDYREVYLVLGLSFKRPGAFERLGSHFMDPLLEMQTARAKTVTRRLTIV